MSRFLHRSTPHHRWHLGPLGLAALLAAPACGRTLATPSTTGGPGTGTTTTASATDTVTTVAPSTGYMDTGWLDTGWDDTGWSTSGFDVWVNPSCDNGLQDGDETDVDCGGDTCQPCSVGQTCLVDPDCRSGVCDDGVCACNPWARPLGTEAFDTATDVTIDRLGHLFVVGDTQGKLGAQAPAGAFDLFFTHHTAKGAPLNVAQLGGPGNDRARAISLSADELYAHVVGSTDDTFAGMPSAGGTDVVIQTMIVEGGFMTWTELLGTALDDRANDVAARPGGFVVVGDWHDDLAGQQEPTRSAAFVATFNDAGMLQWQRLLNSPEPDFATAAALAPNGDILVVGNTWGQLGDSAPAGSQDLFVARFPMDGPPLWVRQLGTAAWDAATDVVVDDGGAIQVLAQSSSSLLGEPNAGGRDVFLIQMSPGGDVQWTRGLGTSSNDYGAAVALHPDGGVVVTGRVVKSLDGQAAFGSWDIFLARYDAGGAKLWTRQLGTAGDDRATGLAIHPTEGLYISASSTGDLAGPNAGDVDGALLHLCE